MNKLSQEVIDKLTVPPEQNVLSIYLPTHRHPTPPHISEDQTRFKNLIQQARSLVEADDHHQSSIIDNLDQLEKKIEDLEFWQQTTESLAIFVSPDETMIHHLPIECEEHVSYSDSYMTVPLIMTQSYNQKFYVLALAMHDSRFYQGDMYNLDEVKVELPSSVEQALNIDEMFANSKTKRSHQGGGANGPNAQTPPHGEGDSSEAGSQERLQYFKIIEKALNSFDGFDPKTPLLIAGTESEANDFCTHSSLKDIVPTILNGNYTHMSINELHALAWPIIYKDIVKQKEQDSIEQINELSGANKASTQLSDIEVAAKDGRIETLLVSMIDQTRDSVSDSTESAPVVRMNNDDGGRLRQLVHLVNQFGGQVLGVDHETLPVGSQAAAVYRY